jgi:ketosteroid isomerase-like protein
MPARHQLEDRDMQSLTRLILALVMGLAFTPLARAAAADEVLALYNRFASAQNARNLDAVGAQFIDSPDFLWVSDGKSFWGRKATLERMSQFQRAEVWRVEPALDQAKVVEVTDTSAFLHMPLDLVIGDAAKPDRITFLVSILCVKSGSDWKIAALFTTTAKPDE